MIYNYTYRKEIRTGNGSLFERTKYRGRCSCGRQTHMTFSTPAMALSAIRRTHNANIEGEEHGA